MRIIISVFFILSTFFIFSQSISGTVSDSEAMPIEYASVRLLNLIDSSVYKGVYTLNDGSFSFEDIASNEYILKITYASHEPYTLEVAVLLSPIKLGAIKLLKDKTLELEGAIVTGNIDALKAGIDKKIYNASDDISTRGGSVVDVLNNIPSIEVDQDGNISLRGDGNVVILIDGRPSTLAIGDGQNLLSALPANSIERIEVVTNPSARYDPDGTSGIINIVLKKNKVKGFNGLASVTAATGNLYEGNFALSYRNTKVNLFMNYSFNYYEGYRNYESVMDREFSLDSITSFEQERVGTDLKSNHTLVLGMDYSFNDNNVLAFSTTGSLGNRERTGALSYRLFDGDNVLNDYWTRSSFDPRGNQNFDVNLNFTRKLKKEKGEWSINLNQSFGDKDIEGFYEENYYDLNETLLGYEPLNQQLFNEESTLLTTAQTDYSYIMPKIKARIELGAKATLETSTVDTYSEMRDTLTDLYIEDTLSNFEYIYDQGVYSVYAIFGQELGKLKYQGGLRGEYAEQIPNLISAGEKFHNTYTNLFPSAHIKYDLGKTSELSFSYSRRINRAKSRQLNPFTSYADPFNLHSGNPELQPEFIDSYDFGYSFTKKKFILTTSVFHKRTTDVISRIKTYYSDNTSTVVYDNIDKSVSTGMDMTIIYKPTSWFKNTISYNANYIEYSNRDTTVDWNNSGVNWGAKYIMSFDFWKRTAKAQLNLRYSAPRITAQGIVQRYSGLDISIEKSILKKKLIFVFKVSDIFDVKRFHIDYELDNVHQISEYKWLTRRFYGTVIYKFGKLDNKL